MTACSLGFQKQVELLKIFIGNLGENMCSPPFYCSLEKAQQCVSEMVAVVQGIGTSSSKNTVCRYWFSEHIVLHGYNSLNTLLF